MSRRKQQKPRHLEADQDLEGILANGVPSTEAVVPPTEEAVDGGDAHVCGICHAEFFEIEEFVSHKATCTHKRTIVSYEDDEANIEAEEDGAPPAKMAKMVSMEDDLDNDDYAASISEKDLNESELISQSDGKSELADGERVAEEEDYYDEVPEVEDDGIGALGGLGEDDDLDENNDAELSAEEASEAEVKDGEEKTKGLPTGDIPPFPSPLASMASMAALMPDSNVKLEALGSTKVAVAQFAENNVAPNDFAALQSTLFTLQQQQLFQFQMLQQIQNQLVLGVTPSLANIPPNLIPPQLANLAALGIRMPNESAANTPNGTSDPAISKAVLSGSQTPTTPATNGTKMSTQEIGPSTPVVPPRKEVDPNKEESSTPLSANTKSLGSTEQLKPNVPGLPPPLMMVSPPGSEEKMNFYRHGKPPNVTVGPLEHKDYVADDPFFKHKCRFCHKVFGSDSALQIHIRSHTGERPFKCNICGNRFSTRGNLKVHFTRHQTKYPHVKMNHDPVPEHLDRPSPSGPPALTPAMMLPPVGRSPVGPPPLPLPSLISPPPAHSHRPPTPKVEVERKEPEVMRLPEPNEGSTCPRTSSANNQSSPSEGRPAQDPPSSSPHSEPSPMVSSAGPMLPSPAQHLGIPSIPMSMPFLPMSVNSMPRPSLPGMPMPNSMGSPHGMLPPFGFPGDHPSPFFRPSILPAKMEDPMEQYMEVDKSETNKLQQLVDNIESKLTDPNQCAICHRILSCKSALQMHYRTHTGERPFKCKICGRAFTTKGNLKTHMGVHRAKPPVRMLHQCPVCHKQFTNALVLQQHIRMHTGELPKDMPIPTPEMMGHMPGIPFMPFPPGFPFMHPGFHGMPGGPTGINGELDLRKHMEDRSLEERDEDYDDESRDLDDCSEEALDLNKTKRSEDDDLDNDMGKDSIGHDAQAEEMRREDDHREDEERQEPRRDLSPRIRTSSPMSRPLISPPTPVSLSQMPPASSYSVSLMALEERVNAIDSEANSVYGGSRPLEQMANILRRQENDMDLPRKMHNGNRPSPIPSPRSVHEEGSEGSKSPGMGKEDHHAVHSPNENSEGNNSMDGSQENDVGPFGGSLPPYGFGPFSFSAKPYDPNTSTTCNVCFKTFACRSALDIHYRSHTRERPFRCHVCDRGFSTRGNMKQHMLTHKIRDLPNEAFDSSNEDSQDLMNRSDRSERSERSETKSPLPPSLTPKREARTPPSVITPPASIGSTSSEEKTPGPPPPLISRSPLTATPMSSSITSTPSSENGNSPFVKRPNLKHVCQMCHKPFSSASALQIHIRTHTGDKPFKCTVCGKAFTTKGNLKVHMGTHMWNNTPSRRGRRMSIDTLPQGMIPSPKDAEFFNNFAHRPPADMFPYPFPGYPNGFVPKMNEISVIQSMNGALAHLPPGAIPRPPTSIATSSSEVLLKTEAMLKAEDAIRSESRDKPIERNNNTPSGASGELDLSVRKSPLASNNDTVSIKSEQNESPKSSPWMWRLTCQLCNKTCPTAAAFEVHMQSHLQRSEQASPKPLMT